MIWAAMNGDHTKIYWVGIGNPPKEDIILTSICKLLKIIHLIWQSDMEFIQSYASIHTANIIENWSDENCIPLANGPPY